MPEIPEQPEFFSKPAGDEQRPEPADEQPLENVAEVEQPLPQAAAAPKRSCLARLFLLCLFLVLLAVGGAYGGWRWLAAWGARPHGGQGEQHVTIAPGTGTRAIGRQLQAAGVVDDERFFLIWLKTRPDRPHIEAGRYHIKTPITPQGLARLLGHGTFGKLLTIPEGWTARQVAARLVREKWITNEEQWLALVNQPLPPQALGEPLPSAEGFLFPETYTLDEGTSAPAILQTMVGEFRRQWAEAKPSQRDPRAENLSLNEVVILASMIEREARTPAEMPRIASVYLNRMNKKMKLQCCATVYYALGRPWDRPLTYTDLKLESPYNTYLHAGLPPGPIANPSRAAMEAVLRPAPEDFLFYVYAGNGQHVFSKTFGEHQKAIRSIKMKNTQEPTTGQIE